MDSEAGASVRLGDVLRIERRYLVNGVLETVTDNGRYKGVELVGTSEHLVLEDADKQEVRLFPLSAISEIAVVQPAPRAAAPAEAAPQAPRWDPSFA